MLRRYVSLLSAAVIAVSLLSSATSVRAEDDCNYRGYGRPDLFHNYWVNPNCGAMGAAMYLSPHHVPPHVGATLITYQPLMPHEFLYPHSRTYHRYYNDGRGLTRTSVTWR